MGSWRKVGAFLGLVPDEGRRDEYGDEYHDADGYRDDYARDPRSAEYADDDYAGDPHGSHPDSPHDPYQPKGPRSMSTGYQDEQLTHGALAVQPRPDLRRDAESTGAIRPVTVKLTGFSEARVIGEKFREGKPVILDMTDMDDAGARRLVDFAAGLAFALRGSIDKVTTKVFMLLPPDTDMADMPSYEPAHAGFQGGFAEPAGRERAAYANARVGR
ncbi:cell division protein SepF [Nakamurella sp. GG22]